MLCLAACQEHAQDGLHTMTLAVWAQLHVLWGHVAWALAILSSVFYRPYITVNVWMQVKAYWTLAQGHGQIQQCKVACGALQHAAAFFGQCQDHKRLHKVYHTNGTSVAECHAPPRSVTATYYACPVRGMAAVEHDDKTWHDSSQSTSTLYDSTLNMFFLVWRCWHNDHAHWPCHCFWRRDSFYLLLLRKRHTGLRLILLPLLSVDCFVLQSGKLECKRTYEEHMKGRALSVARCNKTM